MNDFQRHCNSILYQALAEPVGLLLSCSDPGRAKQALYQSRKLAGDPALEVIQIRTSPFHDGELVLCKAGAVPTASRKQEQPSETL